jgi:hypothetical protein
VRTGFSPLDRAVGENVRKAAFDRRHHPAGRSRPKRRCHRADVETAHLAGHRVHCTDIASEHIDESKLGSVCEPNWPFPMQGVRIDDLFGGCHGCAWRLGLVTVSVNREQNISRPRLDSYSRRLKPRVMGHYALESELPCDQLAVEVGVSECQV